ncbi:bile acid:sodium symporter [candidate division KSB1 bacterium]|nr:bile acid:sodium symporter [candidate division KSB1 bacterium]
MKNYKELTKKFTIWSVGILLVISIAVAPASSNADAKSGEKLYGELSQIANGKGDVKLFETLNTESRKLDWEKSAEMEFAGNLRVLKVVTDKAPNYGRTLYLLRKLTGEVFILSVPKDPAMLDKDADSFYGGLNDMLESKMIFNVGVIQSVVDGQSYDIARFNTSPRPVLLDKIFKIFIILMLFFVMVGMGLTLTLKEFALVFKNPRGIFIGEILQFGVMPLMAFGFGYLLGFYEHYPFIFVGMILITAIPGGVTSNLMTYYAKGDLALSISLTSFSTVLSLIFTPLLLALYCTNLPDVTIPVKVVVQTILILVIIPLVVGMSIRNKWATFAKKATPFFSALGIFALLVLIVAGVLSNLNSFADTARYGVKFYSTVFSLTFLGMLVGMLFPKLAGINNYQTRAISLETGLRNASLAMTIALLIQDATGDFYSSMFFTSGIFGLVMYLAGLISIFLYKRLLPLPVKEEE